MTIKEIAKLAGVSVATVSRVINNSSKVHPDTQKRIEKLMEEHNFVPNKVARSLSKRISNNIAVIVPDIGNEFFAEIFSGISEVIDEQNVNILFFNTNENSENEHNALQMIAGESIRGLIMTPVSSKDKVTASMLHQFEDLWHIPVVLVDRDLDEEEFDSVLVDNRRGAYEGVTALIAAGHERIGIITGPETSLPGLGRLQGYLDALNTHGIPVREEYIVSGEFRADRAYTVMAELMHLKEPPTGIFTSNNETTLGVMKYLTEKKLTLGKDISVVGFDAIKAFRLINYPLTTVARDVVLQGKMAATLLLQKQKEDYDHSQRGVHLYVGHYLRQKGSERYSW